jgi:hypothetical protein
VALRVDTVGFVLMVMVKGGSVAEQYNESHGALGNREERAREERGNDRSSAPTHPSSSSCLRV